MTEQPLEMRHGFRLEGAPVSIRVDLSVHSVQEAAGHPASDVVGDR
jgi:hypothetical protein